MDLPKNYDPKVAEPKWQQFWIEKDIFKFDEKSKAEIYSVDTPPPTVSGKMHIGHAFSYTQQDIIVRYKRMKGFNIFYPFGTDDNGLATERLIEKEKKVKASRMDRKEFQQLCLSTLKDIRKSYVADWKAIGMSCDWNIFYTTINDHSQAISQRSFIDLYKLGREYRKNAPTIWCPTCETAIAQVELKDVESDSKFVDIIFKVDNKDLIIATTRPELLPSCVAIFAHPDDERYKPLFGKKAKVPLFDQDVKIIADPRADPEKGTGIVMCCTFGDQTDIEWYKAHNLPLRISITKNGLMNEQAKKYQGMKIKEARKQIIEDLKAKNLLIKEKEIKHPVNTHERCNTEIEILETEQWFIKYLDLKDDLLKAGNKLKWYPKHMKHRFDNWIKGLQWDWCISRQRYFGVPFPVWYCKKCDEVKLADKDQLPVDPLKDKPKSACKCGSKEFEPEKDVLDTWATSSLTPQLAIELFKDKPIYKKLFPMSLRPQAHDIITFWLFNTVVKSQFHEKKNPWKDIVISGFALDPRGKKMSKSKGNVVEPQKMIEKYSADALRFWAAGSKLGDDLPFQDKDLLTGAKTITKLWNASKFCFMHLEDFDPKKKVNLEMADRWLLDKINNIVKASTDSFEKYEYAKTKIDIEAFFWHSFCDYYLEIAKDRLYNPDKRGKEKRSSAQFALYHTLLATLKLFAPIMPHITEELYQLFFKKHEKAESIHVTNWPKTEKADEEAEKVGKLLIYAVEHARKAKAEAQKSMKQPIKRYTLRAHMKQAEFDSVKEDIIATTTAETLFFDPMPENKEGKIEFEHELEL